MTDSTRSDGPLARHPIKVVARRTGLTPDVIRAWERRYEAVRPGRTETKRRLYTDDDVARLRLLRRATDGGRRIGDVATLALNELERLVGVDEASAREASPGPRRERRERSANERLDTCMKAVRSSEPVALENALSEASVALSVPAMIDTVISPLMHFVGELYRDGELRVSEEHLATSVVRSFLGPLVTAMNMTEEGPSLVVTTPSGQAHEIGALMAAVTAACGGWRAAYLGPNLPSEDIAHAVDRFDAAALLLGICYPSDDAKLPGELKKVRRFVGDEMPILVGGAGAAGYQAVLQDIGARSISDMKSLGVVLDEMR